MEQNTTCSVSSYYWGQALTSSEIWRQKIEGAKTIRHFDLENNSVSLTSSDWGWDQADDTAICAAPIERTL